MLAEFTGTFAERLDRYTASTIKVKQAEEGDLVLPDQILVAPGGRHMTLAGHPPRVRVVALRRAGCQRPPALDRRALPVGGQDVSTRPSSASS